MYETFYGMRHKPFSITPNQETLFESAKHGLALTYLRYALRDNIGFLLLTGDIGTGKTTLLRRLMAEQKDAPLDVAVVFNTNADALQLLQMILSDFGAGAIPETKPACITALNELLIANFAANRRSLLIIDEAQNLSPEALEEVRLLSNLHTDSEGLLQIILCGQPELREIVRAPGLRQLAQRIALSYHLAPLDSEETGAYIRHRLQCAGAATDIFTDEALERVYAHTGGIPRRINILCNAALVYGFADEAAHIDTRTIEQVVEDNDGFTQGTDTSGTAAADMAEQAGTPAEGPRDGRDGALINGMEPPIGTPAAASSAELAALSAAVRRLEDRMLLLEARDFAGEGREQALLVPLQAALRDERERNEALRKRIAELEQALARAADTAAQTRDREESAPPVLPPRAHAGADRPEARASAAASLKTYFSLKRWIRGA